MSGKMVGSLTICFCLLLSFAFLILCFLTGWVISIGNKRRDGHSIFLALTAGFFFLVSIYAIIITGGKTSLLPIPFLCFALLRKRNSSSATGIIYFNWKRTILFFVVSLTAYWIYFSFHFLPSSSAYHYIGGDSLFYSRGADWLNTSGRENVSLDWWGLSHQGPEIYHYGDLWSIALLQRISGIHPAILCNLVLYPVCMTIFLFGLSTWIQSIYKLRFTAHLFLVLLAGFISGFAFLYPAFLLAGSSFAVPIIHIPKLSFATILLIAFIICMGKKEMGPSLLILALAALLFINIVPGMVLAFPALLIYYLFIKKIQLIKPSLFEYLLCVFAASWYILFYRENVSGEFSTVSFSFKITGNILAGGLLQFIPLLPFVLLAISRKIIHCFPLMILLIASIICWALLYWTTPEAVQYFSNIFIPVSAILIITIVADYLANGKGLGKYCGMALLLICLFFNFRYLRDARSVKKMDYDALSEFVNKHGMGRFVDFRNKKEFVNRFAMNTVVFPPLDFISYKDRKYITASMNTPELVADPNSVYASFDNEMIVGSPFMSFLVKKEKGKTLTDYSYLFIKEYKIKYVTVSPLTSLPGQLKSLINDSLLLSDRWMIYSLP